ncbi:LysR family transcriptional regulator [Acidisoma cellulosilytica]|uniref:LysR family transcriptional regulator n=1 Tax=Acidisoma cellulosilyticum TaxID=2802395 RepID=A0A963Z5A3_9PROT|nr:LysR family transcriptional regulator [Acidisoma cellulosilyticum]MCB8883150.1 LysR family transcriptional regulator [Acidisoma cellulosilyticum]
MTREDLGDILNLIAIVEEGSFTKAAARLGVSQSTLSHGIRRLEERLGILLLARTTRSVASTPAGERLMEIVRPAFTDIAARLSDLRSSQARPAGTIRITTPEHAARTLLLPAVKLFVADYPDITVELVIDSHLTDIVAERFDAGVRIGELIAKDMIAISIGPPMRMAAVASPAYFANYPLPKSPRDLAAHCCINQRLSAGSLYAWEFAKAGQKLRVRVGGNIVLNRVPLIVDAALAGCGIAFVIEDQVESEMREGTLLRVLEDWCEPFDGYHLYYANHRQQSLAFSLFVEALRRTASTASLALNRLAWRSDEDKL